MTARHTVIHSMHDVGLAVWCGGGLMGAIGLNGAANQVKKSRDRGVTASAGWARWPPGNAAATAAHAIGGIGLMLANRGRVAHQDGVAANTVADAGQFGAQGSNNCDRPVGHPAVTAVLIVLGAAQGEQQRPSQVVQGLLSRS